MIVQYNDVPMTCTYIKMVTKLLSTFKNYLINESTQVRYLYQNDTDTENYWLF